MINWRIEMNKMTAAILASLYLLSFGAQAADEHKCPTGQKYDTVKHECIKKTESK